MTRQERNTTIFNFVLAFYFVLAGVLSELLAISNSSWTQYALIVGAALVGSIYNWVTGLWNILQSLSCVTWMLGLWLWNWYRSTPDGERAPWWGSLLFVLPGLILCFLGMALKRGSQRGDATTVRPAG